MTMMIFWAAAAALMAIALWFVIPPLTRGGDRGETSRRDINLALHRDKLKELEADSARGTLSPEQFEQARSDLERHLLQDLMADQAAGAPAQRARPRWLVQSLVVALPLCAVAFYVGQQSGPDQLPQALGASPPMSAAPMTAGAPPDMGKHPQPAAAGGEAKAMSMEQAVEQLSKRLAAKPDDGDGWLLLGNSYRFLGKQKEADDAFKRAAALGKTPPDPKASPAATPAPAAAPPAQAAAPAAEPNIEQAIAKLKATLAKHEDDAAGWAELAALEQQQRRFGDAAAAYGRAIALDARNADWLAGAADALASANNSLEGEPTTLIEKALAVDPKHVKALWLAASAARQSGDHAKALSLWQRLAAVLPAGSDDARIIDANIAEAQAAAAGGDTSAAGTPAANVGARIRGTVEIDDALRKELAGGETLFVFARAVNGPPMPLAVLRKTAGDLPLKFELDDSMAVMPTAKLSSAQQVVVGARVSKSGNAIAQPGDLEGSSAAVDVGPDAQVRILIDKRS